MNTRRPHSNQTPAKRPLAVLLLLLGGCGGPAAAPTPATPTITAFSATPSAVTAGSPVRLTWQTTGAASCSLETGDPAADPTTDPADPTPLEACVAGSSDHTYTTPGDYTARLEVVSASGERSRREAQISVTERPDDGSDEIPASFSSEADGLHVTFSAQGAAAPADATYRWTFGDGGQSEGVAVSHTYAAAGTYDVTLTVGAAGQPRSVRRSVTVAAERFVLFEDGSLSAWERSAGGAANWRIAQDEGQAYVEVRPGASVSANNLQTKQSFGDFRLHLEFWVPQTPEDASEQTRGNSGVYLQGRYEVQILDSYGRTLSGQNDAAALYEIKDADRNASRPAETWQSYDIVFRAARFEDGDKTEAARVSVRWNGQLVQDDALVPGPTRLGADETGDGVLSGPIVLQDHGDAVRYRNIWLEPL